MSRAALLRLLPFLLDARRIAVPSDEDTLPDFCRVELSGRQVGEEFLDEIVGRNPEYIFYDGEGGRLEVLPEVEHTQGHRGDRRVNEAQERVVAETAKLIPREAEELQRGVCGDHLGPTHRAELSASVPPEVHRQHGQLAHMNRIVTQWLVGHDHAPDGLRERDATFLLDEVVAKLEACQTRQLFEAVRNGHDAEVPDGVRAQRQVNDAAAGVHERIHEHLGTAVGEVVVIQVDVSQHRHLGDFFQAIEMCRVKI
mmetsp:Transcript_83573/g.233266  ORF Transcript_83573/g.233266 Transcript_83573/m.233266 type:complete len:255 (-) Transcript_83573:3468-4232(-)